jgi:hypothetical protein
MGKWEDGKMGNWEIGKMGRWMVPLQLLNVKTLNAAGN